MARRFIFCQKEKKSMFGENIESYTILTFDEYISIYATRVLVLSSKIKINL